MYSFLHGNSVIAFIFIGPMEREILHNIEDIVDHALPLEKLKKGYTDLNTAKNLILNRVTFCQRRIDVSIHHNTQLVNHIIKQYILTQTGIIRLSVLKVACPKV